MLLIHWQFNIGVQWKSPENLARFCHFEHERNGALSYIQINNQRKIRQLMDPLGWNKSAFDRRIEFRANLFNHLTVEYRFYGSFSIHLSLFIDLIHNNCALQEAYKMKRYSQRFCFLFYSMAWVNIRIN